MGKVWLTLQGERQVGRVGDTRHARLRQQVKLVVWHGSKHSQLGGRVGVSSGQWLVVVQKPRK